MTSSDGGIKSLFSQLPHLILGFCQKGLIHSFRQNRNNKMDKKKKKDLESKGVVLSAALFLCDKLETQPILRTDRMMYKKPASMVIAATRAMASLEPAFAKDRTAAPVTAAMVELGPVTT